MTGFVFVATRDQGHDHIENKTGDPETAAVKEIAAKLKHGDALSAIRRVRV